MSRVLVLVVAAENRIESAVKGDEKKWKKKIN
jgi:hypothetical protein